MNHAKIAPRGTKDEIEEGLTFMPKFDAAGLIPAVVVDDSTNEILMVAFMNEESLHKTLEIGEAVFWSRSRNELWHKGATSGNVQKVKSILVDCDQDCLEVRVEQLGGAACHSGRRSCFYRALGADGALEMKDNTRLFDPAKVYGVHP